MYIYTSGVLIQTANGKSTPMVSTLLGFYELLISGQKAPAAHKNRFYTSDTIFLPQKTVGEVPIVTNFH
jgi:hypothetical protein